MFYKKLSVGMAALMTVGLILAACAAPTLEKLEVVATATPGPAAGAGKCECGFDVVIGHNADTASVNPILARDLDGFWRTHMMFDSLIHLDPVTNEPIPSEDGTGFAR